MKQLLRVFFALALGAGALALPAQAQQAAVVSSCGNLPAVIAAGSVGRMVVDQGGRLCTNANGVGTLPAAATAITASATGTTGATTATLAGVASKTTFICGFTITADATAAVAGAASVTGTIGGTLNYIESVGTATAALALAQNFNPCIPASAVNTGIAVVSAAAGTGGNTAVSAWGFQQ